MTSALGGRGEQGRYRQLKKIETWVLLLAALLILFAATSMLGHATTPAASLPDNDYWYNITGILTDTGLNLNFSDLFRHNNEHLVVIPKLIYAANYLAVSGSNIGLIVYSVAVGALCSALLVLLARGLFVEEPLRFALCALLFPLVMLSTKLAHTYFMGMSGVIWLTADLFVVLSAAALAQGIAKGSAAWVLVALTAALLGVLSYSTAIYSLLVLLLSCLILLLVPKLRGAIATSVLSGTIVVIASVLVVGFAFRSDPPHHPELIFAPGRLADFVLIYIGSSLPIPRNFYPVGGLAILTAGGISIFGLVTKGRTKEILVWIILFLFAPFNALMTGIGRLGFGMRAAEASRYQSVAALTLIATILLVLAALPKGPVSAPVGVARAIVLVGLFLSAPLIAFGPSHLAAYSARNERKVVAEIALRLGIQSDQQLKSATPAIQQLDSLIPVLRATHHAPFDRSSRCEKLIGEHIAELSAPPAGALEAVSLYERSHDGGHAIELSGWAVRDGAAPECVVIVDGERTVIGAGAPVSRRKDLERAQKRSLGLAGWRAVAFMPRSDPVCAVALFSDNDQRLPLSNCEKVNPGGTTTTE